MFLLSFNWVQLLSTVPGHRKGALWLLKAIYSYLSVKLHKFETWITVPSLKGAQASTKSGVCFADGMCQELSQCRPPLSWYHFSLLVCNSCTGELWSHAYIYFQKPCDLGGKMHFLSQCLHLVSIYKQHSHASLLLKDTQIQCYYTLIASSWLDLCPCEGRWNAHKCKKYLVGSYESHQCQNHRECRHWW